MKKLLALSLVLCCTQLSFAQSPQKMSYQSVIRNATGELVVESPVGIKVSILQGSAGGAIAYAETHSVTTNVNGLASLEIGMGSIITGTFAGIDWGNGPYFVKTEVDPSGGASYSMSATTELLSVPYALHAKTADNLSGLNVDEPLEIALDVEDPSSNFPFPWDNEGGFVATFENTNTENGDGIRIKLGKPRSEIVPVITVNEVDLLEAEQILQLLDGATPDSEKADILEGLIVAGLQEDVESIAGMAVGAGNMITSFINAAIGLPLNVSAPINDALDYDFGVAINNGIGLPLDAGLVINQGLGLPWNVTEPINDLLDLPQSVCLEYETALYDFNVGCWTLLPALPDLTIPGVPTYLTSGGFDYTCEVLTAIPLTDDFEGTPLPWSGTPDQGLSPGIANFFSGPDNPSSYTMMYADNGGDSSSVWFSVPTNFNLENNHTFSMKVYLPSEGLTGEQPNDVTLRLQDGDGPFNVWENVSQITKPLVLNQWQTVTFDFLADNWQNVNVNDSVDDPVNRVDFNRVQVFFNGEYNYDVVVAFMDDFSYDGTVMYPVETLVPEGTYCDYTDSEPVATAREPEEYTDLRIPGIPYNTLVFPSIPDFEIPAIPEIPEFQIGDVTITPINPTDLEFWLPQTYDLIEENNDGLSDENEFIRFSDADDSKMGSIRAVNKVDWAENVLNPYFLSKLQGILTKTQDKSHMAKSLFGLLAPKAWSYTTMGVEYSSSFGDYAEWLERVDPDESMRAGSIVGVVGGKISKDLTNAEQVMVVSHSPIVLGNIPEEGKTHLGNNIAFVGQVPVKVMGAVHTGDYIIGNPSTPGFGYAKGPAEMNVEEVNLAVGRSWEDSLEEGPKMVNTVVGVHNGDYVNILKAQAQKLEATKDRLGKTQSKIASLESNMESVLKILSVEANSK